MALFDGLLLLLACIGHVVIVRFLFNYTYLIHFSEEVWLTIVAATALVALAGPIAILALPGWSVFRGGSLSNVHPLWIAYILVCASATVGGFFVILYRRAHETPAAQLANHAETLDTEQVLGRRPGGQGKRSWVARLPWNEIFQVDFTEKQLALARLPPQWDGLSILHLTDLHFQGTPDLPYFDCIFDRCATWNADLIALTGDLLDDPAMADWLPKTIGRLHAPFGRYFILGNHDTRTQAQRTRRLVSDLGWTDLGSRTLITQIRGHSLLLAGVERPWIGRYPDVPEASEPFRLLLTHGPHVIRWARLKRFDLALAGHLHGGQIRLPFIGPITGGKYHGGVFHQPPVVMHVGRGIGGLTPIRWRCRPEVTKLVMRAI